MSKAESAFSTPDFTQRSNHYLLSPARDRRLSAFHPTCPTDNEQCTYVGCSGDASQRLTNHYECPHGHVLLFDDDAQRAEAIASILERSRLYTMPKAVVHSGVARSE